MVISVPSPSTVMPPPLEDHRGGEPLHAEVLGQTAADGGVVVVGQVLLAPGVEDEVAHGERAVRVRDEERPGVA